MRLDLSRPQAWLAGLALLLLLGGMSAGALWWRGQQAPHRYLIQAVSTGDIERSITMTGTIDPVNTVQVGSYVSGIVKEVRCDFNTEVSVGQICARIDPEPFRLVVDQNKADIATGEAQRRKDQSALTYARLTYDRDSKLLTDGVVSADSVDSDRNVLAQAEAQVALDEASLRQKQAILRAAEVNLAYTDILSPVAGMVITRNVDVGQTVVSNLQSSTLFLIAKDLTRMQVDTNVAEADIAAVRAGQHASFTVQAYPDRTFDAVVRQIRQAPITVQSVVTYDVVLAVDNPQKLLLPGMTADTHIITARRENVLRVPLAALRYAPSRAARAVDRTVRSPEDGRQPGSAEGGRAGQPRGDRSARPEGGGGAGGGNRRAAVAGEGRPDRDEGGGRHRGGRLWVLRGGTPTPVMVRVGLDDGTLVEVSGDDLHDGDQVVIGDAGDGSDPRKAPPPNQQQRRPPGLHF